ncbi:MAG: ATP-binding cassette domain-containing protein [Candidatus Aminicenantes bacterium]|nr:ATP-binding cassette domain-containing protein [Candidatus Aminicenantes bacterium]NIM82325.1 ATP-binding cassette domain-containing protein [Candidatus Aminicenantes bacterium]NIN21708.1 ATP-binding cassette domain-containing protein [Candidatus Aminicenantes bacterium]NIN45517.1 ATP-binding cassette domain-containing protein [Candidatus Aminicenantes bacterium]NIN88348.1 ATP-binding cassette domain-containing protein [Candidatus Aminicenantes bacterium]
MDVELVKVSHLNLSVDGMQICPDTNLSLKRHRGYLIAGPIEKANVFLLRVIGGIHPPQYHHQQARVLFQGLDMYESRESVIKEIKKKIAFVFCEGTLISNLTIKENLLLPLQYHYPGYDDAAVMEKINEDFNYFGIPDVLQKRPAEISYDVRKKLAFIRASLQEPELILMDKPLFNLDEHERDQVIQYLENLKSNGITFTIFSRCVSVLEPLIDEAILLEEGKHPTIIAKNDQEFESLSRSRFLRSWGRNGIGSRAISPGENNGF